MEHFIYLIEYIKLIKIKFIKIAYKLVIII